MAEGTISKTTDRGFGFIRTKSGEELFFHMSSVEGTTFDMLQAGQRVAYEIAMSSKGPRAEAVRVL